MTGDLRLLRLVGSQLEQAGVSVLVFGGWAEELLGVLPPRLHRDIDLLLLGPVQALLAKFLDASGAIPEKRSSQKRALEVEGTLVELFLARKEGGTYVTLFWDEVRWRWPVNLAESVSGLRVASREALAGYRLNWATLQAARPT
ncbi:MAG: hypothetical protein WCB86_04635 [Candidatus Dormiibacterota bacterium]